MTMLLMTSLESCILLKATEKGEMATSNIGSNKRSTHLVLAFLVSMMALKQQCQVDAFNRRNLNNNGAAAFIVPSSPLPASVTKTSIIHERLNDNRQRVSSLSMTFLDTTSSSLIATSLQDQSTQQVLDTTTQQITDETAAPIIIEQLSPTTTLIVFIIGIIPFIWATIEFWRRIAVGASFGTTTDSVVIPSPFDTATNTDSEGNNDKLITIGEDNNPMSSRGRQTLDRGALTVAYVLFGVAAFTVGIAVASVVMGPKPDMIPL